MACIRRHASCKILLSEGVVMESEEIESIQEIQARAAKSQALQGMLIKNWHQAHDVIRDTGITLVNEFNDVPGYLGPKISAHAGDGDVVLRVTGERPLLTWTLKINNLNRHVTVTSVMGDRTPADQKPRITTGVVRYRDEGDLVVDEVVGGSPGPQATVRAFLLKTMREFFFAAAAKS